MSAVPNLSLNADVPHTGLRPGMWPPVSLVSMRPVSVYSKQFES